VFDVAPSHENKSLYLTEHHVRKTVVRGHRHNPPVLHPGKWPTYTLDTTENLPG